MTRLLILAALVLLVLYALDAQVRRWLRPQRPPTAPDAPSAAPGATPVPPELLVACSVCGTHVPVSKARRTDGADAAGGLLVCSDICQRRQARATADRDRG